MLLGGDRLRRVALLTVALGLGSAHALTRPIDGAVALPAGTDLRMPFPAGRRIAILSGYGPAMGSGLHRDTQRGDKANDHYALDLNYADADNGGLGSPVLAPLAGEVLAAGWGTAGWANYGQRVYLRHDLGDGHVYTSMYAHLNAIADGIAPGAMVAQGQVLGELGRSCQNALACASFATPHVHFALHRDASFGGSGSGGSYGGHAVVPEPLDGTGDLARNTVIVSSNDGGPAPVCEGVPAAGRVVDDRDVCFRVGGDPQYLRRAADAGWGGGLVWTHAVDGEVDNFAMWRLELAQGGRYRVAAYTDRAYAQSQRARYRVRHRGEESAVVVDQSAEHGWRALGVFEFAAGGDQWVRLDDATGEDFGLRRQIVFDAVRLEPAGAPPPDPDASVAPEPDASAGPRDAAPDPDAVTTDGAALPPRDDDDDVGAEAADATRPVDATHPAVGDGQAEDPEAGPTAEGGLSGGCGCRQQPAPLVLWLGLLLVARSRRHSL